jgi:hypothetical protein
MKISLTTSEAVHRLLADEYAGWTYAGAKALVEYMEELEESCGEEMTFCNVELRCDWSEYSTALEAAKDRGFDMEEEADEDEQEGAALVYLQRNTTVLQFPGGVVVQDY